MRVPFQDVKAQYSELAAPLDAAVHEVLSGGMYLMGKYQRLFEDEMARLHSVDHAIAVNSGTDALRISMDAAGIGEGDEVITTAFTFVASVETIVQTGATPVFVDIEDRAYQIDPSGIEAAITPRTKAIMPVHLFGQLVDVEAIQRIAQRHGLIVIEDAAQAVASTHNGTPAGAFGAAAAFSFYVTKNLGAAGDGGMIVTNDEGIAERARSMRVHGMGRERYYYDYLGYTSRMSELQAAILSVKLPLLQQWNDRRRAVAAIYLEALKGTDLSLPATLPGNNHNWHQFSLLCGHRDELQRFLKEREIDSMVYYPVPLHFHEPYKRFGGGPGSLPVAERVSRQILSLPCHQHLDEAAARHVAQAVLEFAGDKVSV